MFRLGEFTSHSGRVLPWKIDCDSLTDEDWACLARLVAGYHEFGRVIGVPRGGLPFARALEPYATPLSSTVLIVDDVCTTGASMEAAWDACEAPGLVVGVVVYAREPVPEWVTPIFRLDERFADRED